MREQTHRASVCAHLVLFLLLLLPPLLVPGLAVLVISGIRGLVLLWEGQRVQQHLIAAAAAAAAAAAVRSTETALTLVAEGAEAVVVASEI